MQNAIKLKEEVCGASWHVVLGEGYTMVFTFMQNAIKLKKEVWCQVACCPRRGIWLRDQLRGNAGNAIVFTSMRNAVKLKRSLVLAGMLS